MYDIVTFGSATRDSFLRLKRENYRILEEREAQEGKSLCFPLGAKIFIENLQVASGGGATNTAATFPRHSQLQTRNIDSAGASHAPAQGASPPRVLTPLEYSTKKRSPP